MPIVETNIPEKKGRWQTIVKRLGDVGFDPLNQRSSIGVKRLVDTGDGIRGEGAWVSVTDDSGLWETCMEWLDDIVDILKSKATRMEGGVTPTSIYLSPVMEYDPWGNSTLVGFTGG